MIVKLKKPARVTAPAGTVVSLPDSVAALLIRIGHAEKAESLTVEKAVKAPAETAEKPKKKTTRKK